jgi:hypothetical protein
MKTNLRNKMLLSLAAATAVTMFLAAPSFADRGDRGGRDNDGNRGNAIRDRDGNQDRNWDRGNVRNADQGRDRDRDRGNSVRPNWGYPTSYYYARPYTYCTTAYKPVVVRYPAPVRPSVWFWFGW